MPNTAEMHRPQGFDVKNTRPFIPDIATASDRQIPQISQLERRESDVSPGAVVGRFVKHFDRNWRQESLPQEWHNLKGLKGKHIGFSMKSQMELLDDPTNQDEVASWTQKTKQDLLGFKLEYLSDHIVYPCKYERSATDRTRLENSLYGNADMVETVSASERNGSVVRGLKDMKSFFLDEDTPDGSIAVMTSPVGPSGLKTDDGKDIRYPDSYFFIMQKEGDTVNNYTLKTDFTIPECREALYQLTGQRLDPTAPLEAYVETIAKIKPGDQDAKPAVSDIVGALELVRPEYAFKPEGKNEKTPWSEVYADILQGEALYEFNHKTQEMIEEFEAYCLEGNHTKEDLKKATAATILRMSKVFFDEEQKPQQTSGTMEMSTWIDIQKRPLVSSFGGALDAAAERPGCAGGGDSDSKKSIWTNSVTPRLGKSEEDEYGSLDFECPVGHQNTRPKGELIPVCTTCGVSVSC